MMTILLLNSAMAWEIQTTEGGAEYHWPQMPLDYVWVDDDAPEDLIGLRPAVTGAFDAWSAVPAAAIDVLAQNRDGAIGEVALDDDHVVFFERSWPIGNEALAVATTWADEEGQVVSFDIRVNARAAWSTTGQSDRFDLQAALTHEVGHVLGLEHSGIADATMFAAHDLGEVWRQELHDDDQKAVQYLYGEHGLLSADGRTDAMACSVTPWTGRAGPAVALLALLPLVLMRRRHLRTPCC